MEIYIKEENNEASRVELPVLPSSFEKTETRNNQTVEINKIGTIALIGKKGLDTLPLSSFFPRYYNPSYCNVAETELKEPYEYVTAIHDLEGKVCRVVITDTNINMLCLINSFVYGEPDGSGDVSYTLELTEYPLVEVHTTKKATAKSYKTKKNDTLKKIAKKKLKSASKAESIYKKNKAVCKKAWKHKTVKAKNKRKARTNKLFPKGIKLKLP